MSSSNNIIHQEPCRTTTTSRVRNRNEKPAAVAQASMPPPRISGTAPAATAAAARHSNHHHHHHHHATTEAVASLSLTNSMISSSSSTSHRRNSRRQDRLRRKTVKALNEHFHHHSNNIATGTATMETTSKRDEVRLAGHLAADRILWRVSRILQHSETTTNSNSTAAGGACDGARMIMQLSATAAATSDDEFHSLPSSIPSSSSCSNSSSSVVSLDSSELAIRRGRRRGAREANERNSSHNSSSHSIYGWNRNKTRNSTLSSSATGHQQLQQQPSTSSSLLANRGSMNNSSYISPFDLTTIAEHQQHLPPQAAAAAAALTVVSAGQHSKNSRASISSASSSRSWFGGGSKKNKKKPIISAKQAAAMVAGWPTKGHLPQVLQVDQEPHERRDFYHALGKGGGGVGGLFLGGGTSNHPRDGDSHGSSTGNNNHGGGGDAWMCGVCGKAYSTFEAAERHENFHIARVVDQLGFSTTRTTDAVAAATTATTTTNDLQSGRSVKNSYGTQHTQPQVAPLTASNVAAVSVLRRVGKDATTRATNGRAPDTESSIFKSAQQEVLERPTEHAWGMNNGIANHRRGQALENGHDNDGGDDYHDSDQEETLAAASNRNDIYRNHIRDGFLVPRPRHATGASAAAPPSTPLPSSMKQQGSQQQQLQQQSEVRFENAVPSLPLHVDTMAHKNNNTKSGDDFQDDIRTEQLALVLSNAMLDYATLADEALVTVCEKARPLILTRQEWQAELELAYLASDKLYYDQMAERALSRIKHPYSSRLRSEGEDIMAKVQNKFVDAYQLCKEGDNKKGFSDQYRKKQKDGSTNVMAIEHTNKTLYLNVMVKNSIQVVRHELERLARERWERDAEIEKYSRFERFRVYAHVNIVRLAGIALASDFTPRRIAVQLSNDLYRLLTPRLKRRGVTISTEIEYRVGPYFVLAVNINTIRWQKLIKSTYRDVAARKAKWVAERQPLSHEEEEEEAKKNRFVRTKDYLKQMFSLTRYEILAQFFAWFYQLHWIVYQPICILWYYTFLGPTIRHFIISSVADEIFYYVEEKGMEMEIEIRQAATQAAFMLSALREIRADGQELKKKRQQSELHERGVVLGPLLGPAVKADKDPVVEPPGFELPANLEFIGLELDLPVGFRRLRWALLSNSSTFVTEALWRTEAKYDTITMEPWSKCDEYIGVPTLPATVKEDDFVGAEKVSSYLMPKSAFVGANMCTETSYILAYNDYCFCVKKKAATPGVPYGSTFFAWTQLLVVNTGNDTCKLSCSVEPEFPNGPPMVSRQITSGMRAGVGELFVKIGETITKYADEYP